MLLSCADRTRTPVAHSAQQCRSTAQLLGHCTVLWAAQLRVHVLGAKGLAQLSGRARERDTMAVISVFEREEVAGRERERETSLSSAAGRQAGPCTGKNAGAGAKFENHATI